MPTTLLERVVPPLTPDETKLAGEQDASCRSSFVRKNALIWTGSGLIAAAAGLTIGGALATSSDSSTGKLVFGVSAGTFATVGSGLSAIGAIVQQRFTDRGCTTTLTKK